MPVNEDFEKEIEHAADEAVAEMSEENEKVPVQGELEPGDFVERVFDEVEETEEQEEGDEDVQNEESSSTDEAAQTAERTQAETSDRGEEEGPGGSEEEGPSGGEEEGPGDSEANEKAKEPTSAVVEGIKVISDEALTAAVAAGIPIADARGFGSEAALMRVVSSVLRQTEEVKEETNQEDFLDSVPTLDPERYDQDMIDAVEGMKKVIRDQNNEIKSIADSGRRRDEAAAGTALQEVTEWFDGKVDSLGDDFVDSLGKGSTGSLKQGSKAYEKRDELATQISVLHGGYVAAGREVPSRDKIFDIAAKYILGNEIDSAKDKKVSASLKKRSGQHISRVSDAGKRKKNQSAEAEVAEMVDDQFFSGK